MMVTVIRFLAVLLLTTIAAAQPIKVERTSRAGRRVETAHFIADLSARTIGGKPEDSGTIRALTYKAFSITLKRTENRMHWAPNLQRAGTPSYRGIGTWDPVETIRDDERRGVYTYYREGHLAEFPEVRIEAEYRFLAGVPYFLFRSRMAVEKPIAVQLLRNNEMTMDAFFTHVAWPGKERARQATFDERGPVIEADPIAVDAPWTAFYNLEKGYGYGFVNLQYKASATRNSRVRISDGDGNGKYWSRVIIGDDTAELVPGDVFEEVTAFVLFRAPKNEPLKEFLAWERRIRQKHSRR